MSGVSSKVTAARRRCRPSALTRNLQPEEPKNVWGALEYIADRSIAFIFPEYANHRGSRTSAPDRPVECSLVTVTKSRGQGELTKSMVGNWRAALTCISVARLILIRSKSATALIVPPVANAI